METATLTENPVTNGQNPGYNTQAAFCSFCGDFFGMNNQKLRRHIQLEHPVVDGTTEGPNTKLIFCQYCGNKRPEDPADYVKHIRNDDECRDYYYEIYQEQGYGEYYC